MPQVCHDPFGTLPWSAAIEETRYMALQNHLTELERKHEALEREIHEAVAHPSTDDVKLAELKRRKLQLKDEMTRLKQPDPQVH